jgi:hypothetical protein
MGEENDAGGEEHNRKDDTGRVGGASEDAWGAGFFLLLARCATGTEQEK